MSAKMIERMASLARAKQKSKKKKRNKKKSNAVEENDDARLKAMFKMKMMVMIEKNDEQSTEKNKGFKLGGKTSAFESKA